jgi:hypothetical protein
VAFSGGFTWTAAAQPASRPSLTVTPSPPVDISGPQGGPFSPSSIQYHLSASTGTIKFAITPPFWLTADPRGGNVGVDGTTVTLSVNPQASKLAPRAYHAPVAHRKMLSQIVLSERSTSELYISVERLKYPATAAISEPLDIPRADRLITTSRQNTVWREALLLLQIQMVQWHGRCRERT